MASTNSDIKNADSGIPAQSLGQAVVAILDIGKTNKKLFLFDEDYKIVYERSARFVDTTDEDGDPCENLESLRLFVFDSLHDIFRRKEFDVKAINFSTYGASFVYIDEYGKPVAPLYNYLKPYPEELKKQFYEIYGGEEQFSYKTASPVLGSLNSGMQLYRIKYEKHELFKKIKYALHLPQYMSYLLSGIASADITSVGCHTNLWDFQKNDYHEWVYKEGIFEKLPAIVPSNTILPAVLGGDYGVGIGLHDSSAALIPYQVSFKEPFVLISTGTWCISLNPFNQTPLTVDELQHDCLCFMHYQGAPVKASRLFAGNEHEEQVKRIAGHFNVDTLFFQTVEFNNDIAEDLQTRIPSQESTDNKQLISQSPFVQRDISIFKTEGEAYHQLISDIVTQQKFSTSLIINGSEVKKIFVDGGFGKNAVYMNLLAKAFPEKEVFAASMAQATSVGTALAVHEKWNTKKVPDNMIDLKSYG